MVLDTVKFIIDSTFFKFIWSNKIQILTGVSFGFCIFVVAYRDFLLKRIKNNFKNEYTPLVEEYIATTWQLNEFNMGEEEKYEEVRKDVNSIKTKVMVTDTKLENIGEKIDNLAKIITEQNIATNKRIDEEIKEREKLRAEGAKERKNLEEKLVKKHDVLEEKLNNVKLVQVGLKTKLAMLIIILAQAWLIAKDYVIKKDIPKVEKIEKVEKAESIEH